MKKIALVCIVLLFCVLPASVGAVEIVGGNEVVIDTPVSDDLFVSGGIVTINARVDGDVFAVGGSVEINAPITGDLIVAGGMVVINSTIGGKIIAGGGTIELKGSAEKVVAAGGGITITSAAVIEKYALVGAGTVNNAGQIKGDLIVNADEFVNTGTVGGTIDYTEAPDYEGEFRGISLILSILWKLGYLILGLVFIKWFGALFFRIEKEVRESAVKKTIVGFLFIIVAAVICVLLAITVIGLPVAAFLGMFFVMALMVAGLIVSYSLGFWILGLAKVKTNDYLVFVLGFIILTLLFMIPYAGMVIRVVTVSLGFGALIYTVKNNWKTITAPKP
jgi:hypothetical protein